MEKRGQVHNNILMYAIFGIVAVLIILFGYKGITSISEKGKQTDIMELKASLQRDIANLKYGEVKPVSYVLPNGVENICFIDRNTIEHTDCNPLVAPDCIDIDVSFPRASLFFKDILYDSRDNVVLFTDGLPESAYIEKIRLNCCDIFCANKNGDTASFKLEGKGELICIS